MIVVSLPEQGEQGFDGEPKYSNLSKSPGGFFQQVGDLPLVGATKGNEIRFDPFALPRGME